MCWPMAARPSKMAESRYKPATIRDYASVILQKHGVPGRLANISADVLVEADMRGIFSHGINGLEALLLSIEKGGTDPRATAVDRTVYQKYPVRHLDARGGLAYPIAMDAVGWAKDLARKHGCGKVYVFNANHFGAAALYSEKICEEKDLAGRVFCTTAAIVIPYGGKRKRLGTNLIAWSIPYQEGVVTIDMATTIHAVSEILKALAEGTPFPFPVYDQEGAKTTDPGRFRGIDDFVDKGSMIPLGGLGKGGADAGFKGTGLAALIELDSVIGGGFSAAVDPLVYDQRRWTRQIFEAWRIDTLFPRKEALRYISDTITNMKKEQGENMLLPGEKEARQRIRSMRDGISYTSRQIERLETLGRAAGLGRLR
jgi:L-2-hydroxycarboxylate dehydrogenase (NAD+)